MSPFSEAELRLLKYADRGIDRQPRAKVSARRPDVPHIGSMTIEDARSLRAQGLLMREIAERCGVTQQQVSKILARPR